MASTRSISVFSHAAKTFRSLQGGRGGQFSARETYHLTVPTSHQILASAQRPWTRMSVDKFQRKFISTTAPKSVVGWVQEKLAERAQTKKAAKIVDQIALMANSPQWTIKMFAAELDETLSSWAAKLPGASKTTELEGVKVMRKVVNTIMDQLGDNVTARDIKNLDRRQKLKLAVACQMPLEELKTVFESFTKMDIMHRIMRQRKKNGIALPTDEAGLQTAMQQDALKVMTKEEKEEMSEIYGKYLESKKD